jgi:hypothetical protein
MIGASVGMQAYGSYQQYKAQKDIAASNQVIAQQEAKAEAVRQQAMELDARRRSNEMLRQEQRARAMALATSTVQGLGQGSSSLGGAYGQISGQTGVNMLGVSQNLGMGREMFGINQAISQQRIMQAGYQGQAARGSGLASMGSSLLGVAPQFSALMGGYNPQSLSGGYGYNQGYGEYVNWQGRGAIY